jgi:hypothetical protein
VRSVSVPSSLCFLIEVARSAARIYTSLLLHEQAIIVGENMSAPEIFAWATAIALGQMQAADDSARQALLSTMRANAAKERAAVLEQPDDSDSRTPKKRGFVNVGSPGMMVAGLAATTANGTFPTPPAIADQQEQTIAYLTSSLPSSAKVCHTHLFVCASLFLSHTLVAQQVSNVPFIQALPNLNAAPVLETDDNETNNETDLTPAPVTTPAKRTRSQSASTGRSGTCSSHGVAGASSASRSRNGGVETGIRLNHARSDHATAGCALLPSLDLCEGTDQWPVASAVQVPVDLLSDCYDAVSTVIKKKWPRHLPVAAGNVFVDPYAPAARQQASSGIGLRSTSATSTSSQATQPLALPPSMSLPPPLSPSQTPRNTVTTSSSPRPSPPPASSATASSAIASTDSGGVLLL